MDRLIKQGSAVALRDALTIRILVSHLARRIDGKGWRSDSVECSWLSSSGACLGSGGGQWRSGGAG